jgi:hypothetical protein
MNENGVPVVARFCKSGGDLQNRPTFTKETTMVMVWRKWRDYLRAPPTTKLTAFSLFLSLIEPGLKTLSR